MLKFIVFVIFIIAIIVMEPFIFEFVQGAIQPAVEGDVKEVLIYDSGRTAYFNLNVDETKEIAQVKFIFTTHSGKEYEYEILEGKQDVTVTFSKGVLDMILDREPQETYDYQVDAEDIEFLYNFNEIEKIDAILTYTTGDVGDDDDTGDDDTGDDDSGDDDTGDDDSGDDDTGDDDTGDDSGDDDTGDDDTGDDDDDGNETCTPICTGLVCGDDGCGGSCGTCGDSNECTTDSCAGGLCEYTNLPDGTICSGGTCQTGICVECVLDSECDDSIDCTHDSCNSGSCENNPDNSLCSDGDVCDRVYGCVPEIHINDFWLAGQGDSPYYLDTENAHYILETDVTTPGVAFAMISNGIVFDLNGHIITYNNAPPIEIDNNDFQEGSGTNVPGWDLSLAPDTSVGPSVFSHLDEYANERALIVDTPNTNNQYIESVDITLEPNTNYSLYMRPFSAVIGWETPINETPLIILRLKNHPEVNLTYQQRSNRGVAYVTASFNTDGTMWTDKVVIEILNSQYANEGHIYVENVGIVRGRSPGILIGVQSWKNYDYPEVNRYGFSDYSTVKNGIIKQGDGMSEFSHGVYGIRNNEVHDLDITVSGPNTANVKTVNTVHDNNLFNNVEWITSRDNFHGAVISGTYNAYNNVIEGGCQNGIVPVDNSVIHHNTISLKSHYTNGYAIQGYGVDDSLFYSNNIDCTGDGYACRGIFVGGGSQNIEAFDNQVIVQELARVQEYGGCQGGSLSGAYGIQFETSNNISVYNNDVTAISTECAANALRLNGDVSNRDNKVYDNIFKVKRYPVNPTDFFPVATTVKIGGGIENSRETFFIFNNTFITNHRYFSVHEISDLHFVNTTFIIDQENLENPFEPYVAEYYEGYNEYDLPKIDSIKLIDNTYPDGSTGDIIKEQRIHKKFYTDFGVDENCSYYYSWTLDLFVHDDGNPIDSATVIIRNVNNDVIVDSTTNSYGKLNVVLDEFYRKGENTIEFNPYTIEIIKSGYDNFNTEIIMDRTRTLEVDLS
ncbi:hypothetical protein ACFLQN_00560 [Candidatus Aenigmatarchaeota archaeon]